MSGEPIAKGDPWIIEHFVVKRYKRLCIENKAGDIVYVIPDHLKAFVVNKSDLDTLVLRFHYEYEKPIEAIMEFEAMLSDRRIVRLNKRKLK